MPRFLLFLIGLLLLPLCGGLARSILDLFPFAVINNPPWIAPSILAICAGYGCWTAVYLCMPPSIQVYIWGHELTHALWGHLTGAKVGKIHVNGMGGSVAISRPGVCTTLAPYFIPFYTLVVVLLRLVLGLFFEMERWELAWLFLIGLTWSFHITYTLRSLLQHQPDIQSFGRLFSYTLIAAINLLCLGYVLVFASAATLPAFHAQLYARTTSAYRTTACELRDLTQATVRKIASYRQSPQ